MHGRSAPQIQISPNNLERYLLGSFLFEQDKELLFKFIMDNVEVFAWMPYEMPGVDPNIISHCLIVDPSYKPVIQKSKRSHVDHVEAVVEEVRKTLAAKAIKEAHYFTWLPNTVVVKKKNGKWRVCVDFTSLNKACPKDCFPLPRIDQLVDATSGYARMSFLDAYRGYHQIAMNEPDQEKTAFITLRGLYCYRVMPFGLKNAEATYQPQSPLCFLTR